MIANATDRLDLSLEPVIFDPPEASKRIGLIALATDLTTERDFMRVFPADQAGVYATRVDFENPTTPDNLLRMGPRLTKAAALIVPDERLDAICYSCTAASVVIGDETIRHSVQAARPRVPVVTPTLAASLALEAHGARRIAILTPYLVETSRPMMTYFEAAGFDVVRLECFGIEDDREMARISHRTIVQAALRLDRADIDALFISCTALPAFATVAEIEGLTGKPIVTSNQASAWALSRLAGLSIDDRSFGRLFENDLPERAHNVLGRQ